MDDGVSEEARLRHWMSASLPGEGLSHVAYRSAGLRQTCHGSPSSSIGRALWHSGTSATPSARFHVELDSSGADLAVGCASCGVNGGPGAPGFLYVRDDLQTLIRQPIWGWFGQRDQFEMGPHFGPAPGIDAFLTGTPNIIGSVAVEEGARPAR